MAFRLRIDNLHDVQLVCLILKPQITLRQALPSQCQSSRWWLRQVRARRYDQWHGVHHKTLTLYRI